MQRIHKLVIEYDGAAFFGWQKQKEDPTVQGEIEKALSCMTKRKVIVHGAGRTDAGVHAYGQVAHFEATDSIPAAAYLKGLNSLLPAAVAIRSCETMPDGFHARFSAIGKTYRYCIVNAPIRPAIDRGFAWHIRKPLDLKRMAAVARELVGVRDFKAFEATGSPRSHTVRHVMSADWQRPTPDRLHFEIQANGFLRYMVRNIVGTLVDVGFGKCTVERFKEILAAKNRRLAGATAPAQGLFLVKVHYEKTSEGGEHSV